MAGRRSCKIRPVHADGTTCTHKLKPSGRALENGCSGRAGYEATCSCGEELGRHRIRAELEENRRTHLRKHETRPIRTVELPSMDDATEVV